MLIIHRSPIIRVDESNGSFFFAKKKAQIVRKTNSPPIKIEKIWLIERLPSIAAIQRTVKIHKKLKKTRITFGLLVVLYFRAEETKKPKMVARAPEAAANPKKILLKVFNLSKRK